MRWIARWAKALRDWFDTRTWAPVHIVAAWSAVAAGAGAALDWQARGFGRCPSIPISIFDLELTFSARSFFSLLDNAGACRDFILASLWQTDVAFALVYPFSMCALYLWVERYRRFQPDRPDRRVSNPPLPLLSSLLVVAPFAVGLLDIFAENLVLLAASVVGPSSRFAELLVWLGSFGAACKWALLALWVIGFFAMLLGGPRGSVVWRIRYSVFAVLFGAAPLLAIPQGQDILQRLVEGEHPLSRVILAVVVIDATTILIWYCARVLTRIRVDGQATGGWEAFFERNIPRMVGLSMLLLCGLAFARAGAWGGTFLTVAAGSYLAILAVARKAPGVLLRLGRLTLPRYVRFDRDDLIVERRGRAMVGAIVALLSLVPMVPSGFWSSASGREVAILRVGAVLLLVSAWSLYFWVYFRRELEALRRHRASTDGSAAWGELTALRAAEREELVEGFDIDSVPNDIKAVTAAALAVSATCFGLFTYATVPVTRWLGPLVVLTIASANAVVFGSILAWVGRRLHFPIVLLLIGAAFAFSRWNDNHAIRTLAVATADTAAPPPTMHLASRLTAWLAARGSAGGDSTRIPLVLVAAAGGGLRAAYWTGLSLATLQDRDTAFASHVFAMSGVSGGSLGIGVFSAMRRDLLSPSTERDCHGGDTTTTTRKLAPCMRHFMSGDFLSPVLGKFLAPDFTQWFLWFPVRHFDRAIALEQSWERSYQETMKVRTLEEGFRAVVTESDAARGVPPLLLNTTHVETGRRYVTSPFADSTVFLDAVDLHAALGGPDIRLSTAIHNSARFTYVSPAGRLERHDGDAYGSVVDGGYFENSGLATLNDLRRAIAELLDAPPDSLKAIAGRVDLVVLYLCNDPISCQRDTDPAARRLVTDRRAAGEWAAPLRALLATRDARGALAREQTQRDLAQRSAGETRGAFLQLNVCADLGLPSDTAAGDSLVRRGARGRIVNPPLGWLLSGLAQRWMDSSLVAPPGARGATTCRTLNASRIDSLVALVTRASRAPRTP